MSIYTSWSPPGCGRSVTDFWGWGAHKGQLRCPDYVSDVYYIWACSTRRDLKPIFFKLPRPWSPWVSSPARGNSHDRTENRTRDHMVSRKMAASPFTVQLSISRAMIISRAVPKTVHPPAWTDRNDCRVTGLFCFTCFMSSSDMRK
jgi:hypothetical protein